MHNLQMDLRILHLYLKWHPTICRCSQITLVSNTSQEGMEYLFQLQHHKYRKINQAICVQLVLVAHI